MFKIGDKVLYSPFLNCSDNLKIRTEVLSEVYEMCGTQCVKITRHSSVVDVDNLELITTED